MGVYISDRPTENTGSAETVRDSVMIFSKVWFVPVSPRAVWHLVEAAVVRGRHTLGAIGK
jgi:hypothetical protein